MGGFSQITGDPIGSVINANNVSFDGTERGGAVTTDAQLLIGSTTLPHIRLGTIVSPDSSLAISYVAPNIVIQSGGVLADQYVTNSGSAAPAAKILNVLGTSTNGVQTSGSGNTVTVGMASPYADGDFSFQSTVSGQTRTLTVENTSNTASSQANQLIRVAGATAGDAWSQYTVGTANSYSIGVDNSASDNLKFNYSASGAVNPSSGTEFYRYDISLSPNASIFGGGTPMVAIGTVGIIQSMPGSNTSLDIQNTSAVAASGSALAVRVNGAAAGNAQITYDITGVAGSNWNHGILNSSNDEWVLNNGTGDLSGGNMVMVSQLSGETNWPLQPAFLAYLTTTASNVTGNGTTYAIIGYTEIYDQNSDFNPTTGIYTAPVSGRHNFNSIIDISDLDITFTQSLKALVTSNRTYQFEQANPFRAGDGTTWRTTHGIDADMDIGDTAFINVTVSGGTLTVDVRSGGASSILTAFSGKLFA